MTIQCCQVDLHVGPQLEEEDGVEEGGECAPAGAQVVALQVDDGDRHEEEAADVDHVQQEAEALADPLLKRTVPCLDRNSKQMLVMGASSYDVRTEGGYLQKQT